MDFALFHPSKMPHYNVVIDVCCFLFMFVNMGIASTTFNVFQPTVNALPEMNDTLGSLVVSCRMLASFVSTLVVVAYYRIFDCRFGITLTCLSTALAFFLYSISTTFAMFCAASLFAGFSYGLGGLVGTTIVIGRWFKRNQGMALGIATMGSGLAAVILPFVATGIIESSGLASAFRFEAYLALAIGILVYVLLRNHPKESMSITLFHALRHPKQHLLQNATNAADSAKPSSPIVNSTQLADRDFHLILIAILCLGLASIGSNAHIAVLLRTHGFTSLFTAAMLSLSGVVLLVSKLVSGAMYDHIGSHSSSLILGVIFVCGLTLICFTVTGSSAVAVIGIILIFFGQVVSSVGLSKWSLDFTIPNERANTAQVFQMFYTLGTFLGTLFPGFLYDTTGTYIVSYVVFACAIAVCTVIVWRTYSSLR